MQYHRVLLEDDEVHAYQPSGRWTLCGRPKIGRARIWEEGVTCEECVDAARARAIRQADHALRLDLPRLVR